MIPAKVNAKITTKGKYPSKEWRIDWDEMRILEPLDGIEAVTQSLYCLLKTERYAESVYSGDYGVEINALLGKDANYVETVLPQFVEEALMSDDRVVSVDSIELERALDSIDVKVEVLTDLGTTILKKSYIWG